MSSEDLIHDDTPSPAIAELKHDEVLRMPNDLVACRNRIDANTEEQRKHRHVLASLSEKITEFRKRHAESGLQTMYQTLPSVPVPSQFISLHVPTGSCDLSSVSKVTTEHQPLMSSTVVDSELFAPDEINQSLNIVLAQLDEEIERNEKVQQQNFALQDRVAEISQANEAIKGEVCKMSIEVKRLLSEGELERTHFLKKDEENRKILEAQKQVILALWKSFDHVKRQVHNLHIETENDLHRYRAELQRYFTSMEVGLKQLQLSGASKNEENAVDDILKEFESLTTRYLQVIEEKNEKVRKITELEACVKKVNEDRDAAHDSLKKILMMPELNDVRSRKSRSLSPSGHLTYDTIQCVRTALRDQEDEIRQLKWAQSEQKTLASELQDQLLRADDIRKMAQKEASDLQKQLETMRYEKAEVERESLRAKEKISRLEDERSQSQINVDRLQKQVVTINESHQSVMEETLQKQVEECARIRKQFEIEKEEIDRDYNFKLERVKLSLDSLREEKESIEEMLQNAHSECESFRNRLKEKDEEICARNASIEELKGELDDLRESLAEAKESGLEYVEKYRLLEADFVKKNENFIQLEVEKKQLKEENATLVREFDLLKDEFSDKLSFIKKLQDSHHEVVKNAAELQEELSLFKNKVTELESGRTLLDTEMKSLREEKAVLEESLSERNSELASLTARLRRMQEEQTTTLGNLEAERDKVESLEGEIVRLTADNERLSDELFSAGEDLKKKTDSCQRAMNELLDNYRSVEKARSETVIEKEAAVEELSQLKRKFEESENRRTELQKHLDEVEALQADLQKKLCRFEDCAKKALKASRTQTAVRARDGNDIFRETSNVLNSTSPGNFCYLRGSCSSYDLTSPRVNFVDDTLQESLDHLNISSSVEITFRVLRSRIETLEYDKKTLTETVSHLKSEFNNSDEINKDLKKKIELLQKRISDYHDEQKVLESRLSSSRQLLVSQEENIRSKEQQHKTLKAKLLSADLHARDKDAKIVSLNDIIASCRAEISSLEDDKQGLKETIALFELERAKADSLQRQTDDELLRYRSEITALHNKKEDFASRLKSTEEQLEKSKLRCIELERNLNECREFVRDAKKDEEQWKKRFDSLGRKEECEIERQQRLDRLQMELEEAVLKLKATNKEKEVLRKELQDTKIQQNNSGHKIAELQQIVCSLTVENNQMKQRLAVLEKSQKDGRSLGNMLHNELEQLRAEKVSSANDKHNLRRKIERLESERRELEAQRVRLERERAALKQHIETLELEKQKSDAANKQTNIERLALDKSLSAMEKENKELYKNCSQLQKQVAQLEKENGAQLLNESAAQRQILETQVHRLKTENQELEQKISQYDQAHSQSVKFLESKVTMLTKQLEMEKRHRRHGSCNRKPVEGGIEGQKADLNSNFAHSAGQDDTEKPLEEVSESVVFTSHKVTNTK